MDWKCLRFLLQDNSTLLHAAMVEELNEVYVIELFEFYLTIDR